MHTICRLFGYSRQAYYKSLCKNSKAIIDDNRILLHVKRIRDTMPRIGARKLKYILQQQGVDAPRDKLFRIMRENNMLVKRRKRFTVTTNSKHWMKKYPNLIRGFDVPRPNMLWVSDITYIPLEGSYCYLSLITDGCSRKIVGHCLSPTLEATGPIESLKMALKSNIEDINGLIHHSDRGTQYCCKEYVEILKTNNISISMTENGDPYENALAETGYSNMNGLMKKNFITLNKPKCV